MKNKRITWSKQAIRQFSKAINYIANDSIQNAEKVRVDILDKINSLPSNPEIHSPDKFKLNNNGDFRAFELHRYRIAYHTSRTEIRILRVRHTSMEPKPY